VILAVTALKGGVGKTTTSVYLAAIAAGARHNVTLIDADPQASSAEWIESSPDERLQELDLVEAPTDRLLGKALDRIEPDDVAILDLPPGQEQRLSKALERATVAVIPLRVGGIETTSAEAVLGLVPRRVPSGMVFTSARTYTRDYHDTVKEWTDAGIPVWGSIPERVAIAAGPTGWLAEDGLESYRAVWRRAVRNSR
jgi:chromosome partitioning protein